MMTRISSLLLVLSALVFHHAEAFTTTTGSIRRMSTRSSHVATRNTIISMKKKGTDQNEFSIDEMDSVLAEAIDFVEQYVQKKESTNEAIPKKMSIDVPSDDCVPKKGLKPLIDPSHDIPRRYPTTSTAPSCTSNDDSQSQSKKQQQLSRQNEKPQPLVSQEEKDETEEPKPITKKRTIKNNGAGTLGQRYSKKISNINKARHMMERTQKLAQKEHADNILKAEAMMALTTQLSLDQGDDDWNVMQ